MLKALLGGWAELRQRRAQLQQQQQQGGEGDVMPNAEGDAGKAAGGSSRFRFLGALPPVVLVSGGGPSAALPWRCAIDSFTGDEDLPQVGR